MQWLKDERGVTLVELVAGSAAALLILGAVASIEITSLRNSRTDHIRFSNQAEGTTALERIAVDVRQSSGFTLSSATAVTVSAPGGPAVYQLVNGNLQRVAGGVTRVLTTGVGALQFSAEDGGRTLHVILSYNQTAGSVYRLESRATSRIGP